MKRRTFLQAGTIMSGIALSNMLPIPAFADHLPHPGPAINPTDDPYIWLENANSPRALAWSKPRTHATLQKHDTEFARSLAGILKADYDSPDKLIVASRYGDFYYNTWIDAHHARGLFRRTTVNDYLSGHPQWETILDIDALCASEHVDWVLSGITLLFGTYDRMLVSLSRGGADAIEIREFDIPRKRFIPTSEGGFFLPNAKNTADWVNRDTLLVCTEHSGPDSLTDSGYPRTVQRWKRGTALSSAPTIFSVPKSAVTADFSYDHTPGFETTLVISSLDSNRNLVYWLDKHDQPHLIDIPETAGIDLRKDNLLITVNQPWTLNGRTYTAGSLLAFSLPEFLKGSREAVVVFTPTEHTFLDSYARTKNHLILCLITNVISYVEIIDFSGDIQHIRTRGIHPQEITGFPQFSHVGIVDTNPDTNDSVIFSTEAFLDPASLYYSENGEHPRLLQRSHERFNTNGLRVKQFFARSNDGTMVPYFVVGKLDGHPRPTLMTGYGGFGVNETPYYLGTAGKSWLERGGVYVLANIRGGDEYGPNWHFSSVKATKYHCYQDFSSVGYDLVKRHITTPELLACQGGSNGGLLVGVMFSQYGDLFKAIICEVPLLDMYRYIYIDAGASWIGEYGDPRIPAQWKWIGEYSPYQNVPGPHSTHADSAKTRKYPALLLQTTTRDDRVGPAHARKMSARLEAEGIPHEFYENYEGGHGIGADNNQIAHYEALTYDFLWQKLGHGKYNYD